jgi:fermentation-respiration switch protein FrsA (DUF1100 family)
VVVDSAFPTLDEQLEIMVTAPLLRPLIRFFGERETGLSFRDLRPVEQIGQLSPRPVFIIQGTADSAIPPDSAQRLYDSAGEPRLLWIEHGAGHVGTHSSQPAEYKRRVIAFFETALPRGR